jgi:hypothetical protein
VADSGSPYAFTLNLGPRVVKAANDNASGFTSYVANRLRPKLKQALGRNVPFWFTVDVTASGRPHLHGGVALNDNELPAFKQALAAAGGKWAASHGDQYQVDVRPQFDPDGWVNSYCFGKIAKARRYIKGNPLYISNTLRQSAKVRYEADRRR